MGIINNILKKMIFPKKVFVFSSGKIFVFLAIVSILILAFLLRVCFSYDIVFSSPMKYAGDDGIYHMRIIENELLGDHFPERIFFDPYTNFPNGTYIHFAPLYDYLPAFLIWIATLGHPTQEAIDSIAPFYPPFLGILSVLVIYLLGRVLWGNAVGLIAALIAAISPSLVFRSLLGATDHHVAETLFSLLAIFFLFCLLKFQEKNRIYSSKWWILTILTGIALGLYFLVWEGALLFLLLFFIFFVFYFIQEYLSAKPWKHILLSGAVIFFIVLMMLIPFLGHPNLLLSPLYNFRHIGSLVLGLIFFLAVWAFGELFSRKKMKLKYFLPLLVSIGLFLIILLYFIFPDTFRLLIDGFKTINTSLSPHENARELTNEMRPLKVKGAIDNFLGFFFFSLGGLIMIIYSFIKKRRGIELLLIIWFFVAFIMSGIFPSSIGQIKYIYYLWMVAALLSALFLERALVFAWRGLKIIQEKGRENSPLFLYALIGSLLTIFSILIFLLFPFPFNVAAFYPNNLPLIVQSTIGSTRDVIRHSQDWYESLKWLRENTPTPSLDYYSLYQEPGIDPKTGKILPYDYPDDSYGVLARWDKGHAITYYSQRMAVSNPFHQGIGKKDSAGQVLELGDGVFFLETNEKTAINYLDQLKVKYLITDSDYAHPDILFKQMVKWVQKELKGYEEEDIGDGPSRFDNSMIARLHLLDGRGTSTERERENKTLKFEIIPLDHFRLVYESDTSASAGFFKYSEEDNIKMVKIFEYIKGAKIIGETSLSQEVSILTEITTNQGRKFLYEKKTIVKDNKFEFVVPYSTFGEEGRLAGQTQFAVFAQPYKVKIGNREIEVSVSEEEILEGKTIKLENVK